MDRGRTVGVAMGMFAGLRSAERNELDWKDIHLDGPQPYIDLSAKIAKTGRRRLATPSSPLPGCSRCCEPRSRERGIVWKQ